MAIARLSVWGLLALSNLVFLGQARAEGQNTSDASPKLMLRTSGGIYKNKPASGGVATHVSTTTSMGGFNIGFHYFLTPQLSAGFGYKVEFDTTHQIIPFRGFDVTGRLYPFGQGTYTSKRFNGNILEFSTNYTFYLGGNFAQRSYTLKVLSGSSQSGALRTAERTVLTDGTVILTGAYAAVDTLAGIEMRLSRHFELNVEVQTTALSFANTDVDVRISSTLVNTGLNYVW